MNSEIPNPSGHDAQKITDVQENGNHTQFAYIPASKQQQQSINGDASQIQEDRQSPSINDYSDIPWSYLTWSHF